LFYGILGAFGAVFFLNVFWGGNAKRQFPDPQIPIEYTVIAAVLGAAALFAIAIQSYLDGIRESRQRTQKPEYRQKLHDAGFTLYD